MRTRPPALRTLPSGTVATWSFCAIVSRFSFLPLKAKDEVRPVTRSASTWANALRISAAMPSAKYS